jgi:uncharacterized protein YfaT (DUF1175 family)
VTFSIFVFFEQLTGCCLNPSQIRHPERSAARTYRFTDGLCAKSKDPGDVGWQMLFQAFQPRTSSQIKKSHKLRPAVESWLSRGPLLAHGNRARLQRAKHLLFAASALILLAGCRQHRPSIEPAQIILPADGAEHDAFRIHLPWLGSVTTETSGLRLLASKGGTVDGLLRAPVNPGNVQLHLHWRQQLLLVPVTFTFDPNDSHVDGTPDFLRLHTAQDRQAFRTWFTGIAEAQANLTQLPAEIDDCAALLRFSYREALHAHDEAWLATHSMDPVAPSIQQYAYPQTPLGANLFRVRPGPFLAEDIHNGGFAQFADARTLMQHNTYLVSRDLRQARPGDLIFYRQLDQDSPYDVPTHYHSPFHSMIVCGATAGWVVYHTGPIHHSKGEMRRLSVNDLLHHPDARWRPVKENANFLGVYRWNILREGD